MKYEELSADAVALISYRCRLTKEIAGAAREGKRKVRVGEAK